MIHATCIRDIAEETLTLKTENAPTNVNKLKTRNRIPFKEKKLAASNRATNQSAEELYRNFKKKKQEINLYSLS